MPHPRQDRSSSRCERSKSNNHSKPKQPSNKPQRNFLPGHQLRSFQERYPSPLQRHKQNQEQMCSRCETLLRRGKERQAHFKQIVAIYHSEMDKLKEVNESLREQLEVLHQQNQQAIQEAEELRQVIADCQPFKSAVKDPEEGGGIKRRKELELCISPIEKGKEPIIIQRISQKLLSELESPTFSQLLAGTPQVSNLDPPQVLQASQKQNALRAQFDRLMGQCESTSNRSKKTTLRKQMASIANQLSSLGRT